MKAFMLLKLFLILPLIILIDYIIMVVLGCASCLLGFGEGYFCSTYCIVGKGLLLLSAIIFGIIIYPDIKAFIKHYKNVETQKK